MAYTSYMHVDAVLSLPEDAINGTEFRLLMALAKFANKKHTCWPTNERILAIARMSLSTYHRTVSSLKRKGLIRAFDDSMKRIFDLSPLVEKGNEDSQIDSTPPVKMTTPPCQNDYPLNIEVKIEEKTKVFANAKKKGVFMSLPVGKKASDILESLKQKKPYEPKALVPNIISYWKRTCADELDMFVKDFTQKQAGQMKMFVQTVGEENAKDIVGEVLLEWSAYTSFVRSATGVKTTPEYPNVGFLMQYASEAVNFYNEVKAPVQLIAQKKELPLKYTKEDEDVLIAKILGG